MINFIAVDDIEFFRDEINDAILAFSMKTDIPINKYIFDEYNKDFRKISNSRLENKIYILDIETPKHNGIDEAKKIRKKDENSTIIFLTNYESTYYPTLLRSNIKYNFVSKGEVFKIILNNYFKIVANNIYSPKGKLMFNDHNALINISYEDIIYIYSRNNKNIIKTINNEISTRKSLEFLLSKLPKYFVKSHRACLINIKRVIYIRKEIIFSDGSKTYLLSRTYKNSVIKAYKKEQDLY